MKRLRFTHLLALVLVLILLGAANLPADGAGAVSGAATGNVNPSGSSPGGQAALSAADADVDAERTAAAWELTDGRDELYAVARAYPDRVTGYGFRENDWAVEIDGDWYYWANARILTGTERHKWREFQSYRFYSYPLDLPSLPEFSKAEGESLSRRVRESDAAPPKRSEGFLGALFDARDRADTLDEIVTVNFLGFRFQIHNRLVEPLAIVEADVLRLAELDDEAAAFVRKTAAIGGFSFRSISGQLSRSYHSYGLALDLVPRSYEGRFAYWRWAYEAGVDEWWAIPYEKRWMAPESVIRAFERQGFVWGGKWLFFDTIHFEYRPEILILSRLSAIRDTTFR